MTRIVSASPFTFACSSLAHFWALRGNWDRVRGCTEHCTTGVEAPAGSQRLKIAYWYDCVARLYLEFDRPEEAVRFMDLSVGIREYLCEFGNCDRGAEALENIVALLWKGDAAGLAPRLFNRFRAIMKSHEEHDDRAIPIEFVVR